MQNTENNFEIIYSADAELEAGDAAAEYEDDDFELFL